MSTDTRIGLDLETLELILGSIEEFAHRELPESVLLDLDERDEFPADVIHKMCSSGARHSACSSPRNTAACGGTFDIYGVRAHGASIGVATAVLATFLGSDLIGSAARRSRKLDDRIADEGLLMAYGATEPEAGSDLAL
jgi:alkylation response protein AidB-like acyl-CoA dehydrogenase